MFIDIHSHLDMLETTPQETLSLAQSNKVGCIITIGTEPTDHPKVLEIASQFFPAIACTLGVHPHQADLWNEETKAFIIKNSPEPYVVAVGEIGLDYYYNNSPKDVQKNSFREQLALAQELNLPVQIHTRDADKDTQDILAEFKGRVSGVIHCFTGTKELAKECLDLGYFISISGVVTFKNADSLRSIVKDLPLDRILIETDSPFLTPVPHRGKKNSPHYVTHVAEVVASLKQITVDELKLQLIKNTSQAFPKLKLDFLKS